MRVFVTGGNGFIGSVVVRQLVSSGHSVACLLRATSNTKRIDDLPFERVSGDVRDLTSVRSAIRGCDSTVHLAAPAGWDDDDASALFEIIEGGTRNILEAAAGLDRHRVVFVSSTAAINASEVPRVFDEGAQFTLRDPSLAYAHAKHRAEGLAAAAWERGVQVVIVNPAEVYGPGDSGMVTSQNLIDFAKSTPVLVCAGGTGIVHVDDVAAGVLAALERGRSGQRYILAGDNVTIRELAELVLEVMGHRAPIVSVPTRVARAAARLAIRLGVPLPFNPRVVPYATRYWFVDNAKARRELGVTFRGARDTIRSTLDWLTATGRL
jgi:dihydroflavonol-4-reductase